jgi:hypothetical protein
MIAKTKRAGHRDKSGKGTLLRILLIDAFHRRRQRHDRYLYRIARSVLPDDQEAEDDGRFATLADVVNHYDNHFQTALTEQEKADLIEYLKSI